MATSKFFCSFLLFMEKIIEISICIIYCFYQRYLFLNILVVFYLFSYLQLPERMNLIELNTEIHTYILDFSLRTRARWACSQNSPMLIV
jgi:hypothetical protein